MPAYIERLVINIRVGKNSDTEKSEKAFPKGLYKIIRKKLKARNGVKMEKDIINNFTQSKLKKRLL